MIPYLLLTAAKRKALLRTLRDYAITPDGVEVTRILIEELGSNEEDLKKGLNRLVELGDLKEGALSVVFSKLSGEDSGDWSRVPRRRPMKLRRKKCTLM